MAGCVQLDVRGRRTPPARPGAPGHAGTGAFEGGVCEGGTCEETRTSEGGACEEARAPEGGACEEARAPEGGTCEGARASEGSPREDPSAAPAASAACACEGCVMRADGTLPRGHCS